MTHVLVVEDDSFLRTELQEILENRGLKVTAVDSGRRALKVLDEIKHDIVLTDIVMADGEGIELIRKLRDQDAGIQIIAMSAVQTYLTSALALGANGTLLKPFTTQELSACLETAAYDEI